MKMSEEGRMLIQAAGGLVWRDTPQGKQIALVHRPKYDDWTLPKGKLKDAEDWQAAALREVEEELQCRVEAGELAGSLYYMAAGIPKLVLFWHMEIIEQGDFHPNREIDQRAWLSVTDALDKLSYKSERELLMDVWASI